ncbi:MAG: transglycosylase SLT domain-containing protein [Bacteroidales bacterium]|jgi:membrane-bound lytic murein transglycosylase D|nr:transglycosylase SLT domain-containing protein [Bacteroidales bacterium]MDI9533271.1 transglycosylase SLT domain-containing protein [Bacteroidota bacterium]MBP8709481.1 transglycosylase SLT domain-containing protein [Bacteroidales bacterium]HOC05628.1 transglycosylase SLT domain-containing protein [Bacteroidales bacterium]HPA68900.1 transglycosylase SLT domain-containing protein [Bacteroidales bacterium]
MKKNLKKIILPLFLSIVALPALAVNDTIIIRSDESTELIEHDLDSLLNNWFIRMSVAGADLSSTDSVIHEFSDSIYKDRLSRINSIIIPPYNNIVRNHIHVYTERKVDKFRVMLGLQDYYFPMIEDIFDSYGLPVELKYMAVIESALNPNAVSRAGATGLWQFMYSTGRMYGLTINSVVDERRDPVRATHAAAKYLKDLYGIYNDWILVIAAYNCGPGNVNKAIRRSGNRKDYWEIYYRLPRETRGYIPAYVAATYAMNYYREHNITPIQINLPLAVDTVMVSTDMHLEQITAVLDLPLEELRAMNPQYRTGLVPGRSRPSPVTLPLDRLGDFIAMTDTITGYRKDQYLTTVNQTSMPQSTASTFTPPDVTGKTRLTYTVKEGDNLGFISEWYDVPLSELRYWNNIYRNIIRVGQKLTVYVDPSKAERYSKINSMTFAEKQQLEGKPVGNTSLALASPQPLPVTSGEGDYVLYTVRYGDTVWDIAKKFSGVSVSDILSLNNITDASRIKVGQKLRIRKKS